MNNRRIKRTPHILFSILALALLSSCASTYIPKEQSPYEKNKNYFYRPEFIPLNSQSILKKSKVKSVTRYSFDKINGTKELVQKSKENIHIRIMGKRTI